MKMQVEGTWEEIRNLLEGMVPLPFLPPGTNAGGSNHEDTRKFVTTEFARRVLGRRRLTANSMAVLFMLYRAPFNEFVTYAHIKESVGLSEWEFRGVKGGLGKRISSTDGYERGAIFFEYNCNEEERKMRLPASVREAMQEKFPELSGTVCQVQSKSNSSAE